MMKGLLFRSADGLSDVARAAFKRILKLDAEFCFDPHHLPAISHAEEVKAPVRRSTDGSRKGREGRRGANGGLLHKGRVNCVNLRPVRSKSQAKRCQSGAKLPLKRHGRSNPKVVSHAGGEPTEHYLRNGTPYRMEDKSIDSPLCGRSRRTSRRR